MSVNRNVTVPLGSSDIEHSLPHCGSESRQLPRSDDSATTKEARRLPLRLSLEAAVAERPFPLRDRLAATLARATLCGQLLAKGDEAGIAEDALAMADRATAPLAAP